MNPCTRRPASICLGMMATIFLLAGGQNVALAQSSNGPRPDGVVVSSIPAGVLITLQGEYEFVGRTPFTLPYPLTGQYRIKATKDGYESKARDHIFSLSNGHIYEISLTRRTPARAFYRSLLLPGWGHFYTDRKAWGVFYSGLITTSFVAAAVNQSRYRDSQSEYEDAFGRFTNAEANFAEQNIAFADMQRSLRDLDHYKKKRNRSLYFAGGVWLFSMLENLIFFPTYPHEKGATLAVIPSLNPIADGATLQVRIPIK